RRRPVALPAAVGLVLRGGTPQGMKGERRALRPPSSRRDQPGGSPLIHATASLAGAATLGLAAAGRLGLGAAVRLGLDGSAAAGRAGIAAVRAGVATVAGLTARRTGEAALRAGEATTSRLAAGRAGIAA